VGPIDVIIWEAIGGGINGAIGAGIDGARGASIPWPIFDVPPWYPRLVAGIDGARGASISWPIFDVPPWYPRLVIRYSFMESICCFISKIK
jgi:hypothetical protein